MLNKDWNIECYEEDKFRTLHINLSTTPKVDFKSLSLNKDVPLNALFCSFWFNLSRWIYDLDVPNWNSKLRSWTSLDRSLSSIVNDLHFQWLRLLLCFAFLRFDWPQFELRSTEFHFSRRNIEFLGNKVIALFLLCSLSFAEIWSCPHKFRPIECKVRSSLNCFSREHTYLFNSFVFDCVSTSNEELRLSYF